MKKRTLAVFLAILCLLPALTACTVRPYSAVLYNKMNTDVLITLYSDGKSKKAAELIVACEALLDETEKTLSRTAVEAELARVNASGDESLAVSDTLAAMLRLALALAAETGGAFDPTAGALSALYDITGNATPLLRCLLWED